MKLLSRLSLLNDFYVAKTFQSAGKGNRRIFGFNMRNEFYYYLSATLRPASQLKRAGKLFFRRTPKY